MVSVMDSHSCDQDLNPGQDNHISMVMHQNRYLHILEIISFSKIAKLDNLQVYVEF